MKPTRVLCLALGLLYMNISCASNLDNQAFAPGANNTQIYLPLLQGKNVAVVCNQNSKIGDRHLVDSLMERGVQIRKVFSPEHGFNINYSDGAKVQREENLFGLVEVISLYGKYRKPQRKDLEGIEFMIFDLQDVGVRFYTYLSTLHYTMEACAEYNIPLLVLDRPNPNGGYLDGPVLDTVFSSFVGMHPVPVVYGLTIGEYAKMINGEGWLKNHVSCSLTVIACKNYKRNNSYELPGSPSPNLPNTLSISLYPTLAFFEGTPISIGRGTDFPFQVLGHPDLKGKPFSFTPRSIPEASISPILESKLCFGYDLRIPSKDVVLKHNSLNLQLLINIWNELGRKPDFFTSYFRLLAGTDLLEKQISKGLNEQQIRNTWQEGLYRYKKIRIKYLIYPDFDE